MIVAGSNPPNPSELIESAAMDGVPAQLAERYELVVIDTAPMGVVSDAFPLLRKIDGVIVVTRIGMCTRDTVAHLREQLARLEAPVLGIVANAVKAGPAGALRVRVLRRVRVRAGAEQAGAAEVGAGSGQGSAETASR